MQQRRAPPARQAFAVKPENAAPSVTFNSFIISNTFSHDMKNQWTVDKAGMEARQVRILQKHWHRAPLFGAVVSLASRCQRNDPLAIARDGSQADGAV